MFTLPVAEISLNASNLPVSYTHLTKYSGKKLVILELGIGSRNRLIKLPIMQLAYHEPNAKSVSYTHLDVYKRQELIFIFLILFSRTD